ncbi:four helix bundle protein [Sphingobacterium spiritivorum]|uniref:four helix bundle protein n=1 Tax=Sphingobacterium spiritivorum TaxID=258 RepID=UPI003DA4DA5E
MKSHKDLIVYQRAMAYVKRIYDCSSEFPDSEKFGLINQLRRAAVSIPSNIAEGAARQTKKEFVQFLYISLGSLSEVETQLELAQLLGYIKDNVNLIDENSQIRRMLLKLIESLRNG